MMIDSKPLPLQSILPASVIVFLSISLRNLRLYLSVTVDSFSDHKSVTTDQDKNERQEKVTLTENSTSLAEDEIKDKIITNRTENKTESNQAKQEQSVIPGLGVYSDSSDSESSASDSS